ncbi:hypothetical protein KIN20_034070 [Parelaphostrongylus tenuis]|uniref:Uncharacterized protein n=1 Tax=Parelaphostrongylus tenuis TaxID=148309 RepID=A0AAD5R9R6_PARTN|nr:hypothetical protein KIN20_034070 [Parelaphostrongylus tenuis]
MYYCNAIRLIMQCNMVEVIEIYGIRKHSYSDVPGPFTYTIPNSAYAMESFDVTALYTKVSNDSALQATHELLVQHQEAVHMYGLPTEQFMVLLKVCSNSSLDGPGNILLKFEGWQWRRTGA